MRTISYDMAGTPNSTGKYKHTGAVVKRDNSLHPEKSSRQTEFNHYTVQRVSSHVNKLDLSWDTATKKDQLSVCSKPLIVRRG